LLLLPGAGADPDFWKPVSDRLPATWVRLRLAWPGIGHNPPDPTIRGFADLVALAERKLLELAEGGGKVDVLAQSMGGAIALSLALKHPEHIRRLVLTVTAGGMDVEALGAVDWRPSYRQEYPTAADWLYGARPDFSGQLGRIVQPTLLVWGDNDPISPLAVGEEFQRRMPDAQLVVIAGGTHALALERPDQVAALVHGHLAG
jgi:pimeloyl-ACP methyl ester carboxylesterase